MPAGAICGCGRATRRRSRKCERCEQQAAHDKKLRQQVYSHRRWPHAKLLAYARDQWRCRKCRRQFIGRPELLDGHHNPGVLELLRAGLDPFDPAYIETLCHSCHGGTRSR